MHGRNERRERPRPPRARRPGPAPLRARRPGPAPLRARRPGPPPPRALLLFSLCAPLLFALPACGPSSGGPPGQEAPAGDSDGRGGPEAPAAEGAFRIVDSAGAETLFEGPPRRIVSLNRQTSEAIALLQASDLVVGTGDNTVRLNPYLGFGSLPEVGSGDVLNVEAIVALRPDAVFAHTGRARFLEGKLGGAGIRVVRMDNFYPDSEDRELELLGRILRREGRARAFLEWKRAVRELHSGRVGPVPPQDRKGVAALSMGFLMSRGGFRVFPSAAAGGGKGSGEGYSTILAGGLDACPELALPLNAEGTAVGVSGEYLLLRDPEFVTLHGSFLGGHGAVDDREIRRAFAAVRENPTLRRTRAGRDGNVYFFHTDLLGASKREPGVLRLASVLYPELFRDVDPEAPLREYFEKWLERPYRGVWFYGERVGRGGRE